MKIVSSVAVPSILSNSSGEPKSEYNASMFELNTLALSAIRLFAGKAVATAKYFLGLNKTQIKAMIVARDKIARIIFHRFSTISNRSGMDLN